MIYEVQKIKHTGTSGVDNMLKHWLIPVIPCPGAGWASPPSPGSTTAGPVARSSVASAPLRWEEGGGRREEGRSSRLMITWPYEWRRSISWSLLCSVSTAVVLQQWPQGVCLGSLVPPRCVSCPSSASSGRCGCATPASSSTGRRRRSSQSPRHPR